MKAEPLLVRKGELTAVAVSVEMGHTVAFVGSATGEVETLTWGTAERHKRRLNVNVPVGAEGAPVRPP